MSYRIITDSCCDFPQQMYSQLDLGLVPLSLNFGGQVYSDFPEDVLKKVYAGLRAGENASTSAANPDTWANAIRPALEKGEDALVMAFSSGLSTTYQSAVIAASDLLEEFPDRTIKVVDTLAASMGQGLFVWYACQKRDAGMPLEELAQWCEDHKQNIGHWFTVDDLMYLKRGGRVSAATAIVGTMLQIKPVLHVDAEGHLISVAKARGRKASLDALVKKMEETALPGENDTIFISHGDCLEDAQYVGEALKRKCGVKNVVISYVGGVIGSHAGPGTVALFFMASHR